MTWTTPDALTEQVLKVWDRGDILRARLGGDTLFPLELRLKRPSPREVPPFPGASGYDQRQMQVGFKFAF